MPINISSTMVDTADQTSFTVFVDLTVPQWKTSGNGGNVQHTTTSTSCSASGATVPADFILTSDIGGTTQITGVDWDTYDATSGRGRFWYMQSSLSHTVNTVPYVSFNNASVSTCQNTRSAAWNSAFKLVLHLPDGTTLTAKDSTAGGNDGTITTITATTGQIDGAGLWDGNSAHTITTPTQSPTTITISAWVKPNCGGAAQCPVVSKNFDGSSVGFILSTNTTAIQVGAGIGFYDGSWHQSNVVTDISTSNAVHHVAGTYDGTTLIYYLDGVSNSTASVSASLPASTSTIDIGRYLSSSVAMVGFIDELHISNTARAASWIKTEYNNQSAPGTYITAGTVH